MGAFDSFYSGAMAPPTKAPGGRLVPSLTDMYSDVLPAPSSGGLTTRKVDLVTIDANGNPVLSPAQMNANDVIVDRPAPVAPSVLDAVNPLDVSRLGLTTSPFASQPAVQAIESAAPTGLASLYGSAFNGGWGSGPMTTQPNGMPIDSDRPLNRGGPASSQPAAQPAPVAPPNPVQTLAQMFTPANPRAGTDAAFAADVTRQSTVSPDLTFTGTVQRGEAGQNRYGSTGRNELLAMYGG